MDKQLHMCIYSYIYIYIYIWLSAKIERYETAAWVYTFHTRFIPPC